MKARDLRSIVMHVSTRCDQTCVHCSIWSGNAEKRGALGLSERQAILREARDLGATSVLFTGGEPLLCDHIEGLSRTARELGLQVQIATNGLGLLRSAGWICESVDEVYVSLDGPEEVHDRLRGAKMFGRLRESISTLRARPRRPRLIARSTVSSENIGSAEATVESAREMGFDRISFLAVDTSSSAFGDRAAERSAYAPSAGQIADFRAAIDRLSRKGDLGVFVVEDRAGLNRVAASFESLGETRGRACNAPEWSSVIEADGRMRPCFFQPVTGSVVDAGLRAMRASVSYQSALDQLGPENPTCARCVCPKFVEPAWRQALRRFRSAIATGPVEPRERVA